MEATAVHWIHVWLHGPRNMSLLMGSSEFTDRRHAPVPVAEFSRSFCVRLPTKAMVACLTSRPQELSPGICSGFMAWVSRIATLLPEASAKGGIYRIRLSMASLEMRICRRLKLDDGKIVNALFLRLFSTTWFRRTNGEEETCFGTCRLRSWLQLGGIKRRKLLK
ncbi:hypothetical protein GW17_00024899 [Ensete ventricosum]|nr:hypothetical protein GW17_00024899 [Ensete ventricosum]